MVQGILNQKKKNFLFTVSKIQWVNRKCNVAADLLAKFYRDQNFEVLSNSTIPYNVLDVCTRKEWGTVMLSCKLFVCLN